jgi:hypothetical protein
MGIVNPPEVHPGILRALYRLCVARGQDFAATSAELVSLLAPAAAVHEGADPQRSARHSVTAAQGIHMLVPLSTHDSRLRLGVPAPPDTSGPADAESFFVGELRRLVMASKHNTSLFGEAKATEEGAERERDEKLSSTEAREFTRIQAWLLMQDPTKPSLFYAHKDPRRNVQQLQNLYSGRDLVVNSNRWTNFRRWSLFLGFSRQDRLAGSPKAGLVPDPTQAVRDEIDVVRAETREVPLVELRDRLAERLPVLDGGAYRREVRSHVGGADDPRIASPALALALLRCEQAKILDFATRDDFAGGRLTVGTNSYTHVRFGGT